MIEERQYDIVIIGSGAGGGTVAQELGPLVRTGTRVLLIEQGPRLHDHELSGQELDMLEALYEDAGALFTSDGTVSLSLGRAYGGSTAAYTGTARIAPERVIERWHVPGLTHDDIERRSRKFLAQTSAHELTPELINDNNRLFVDGCRKCGWTARQFALTLSGCRGSGVCSLGCPNGAMMGTNRVQLPNAESSGVEVVTRAEALEVADRVVTVRISPRADREKGLPSEWAPGTYRVSASLVVLAGGAVGTSALILRSPIARAIPHVGARFTCHPAQVLVAEHERAITNQVGHPRSYYLDRADSDGYVLETCMCSPFVTARNMAGFGSAHSRMMLAFRRLQMVLLFACDRATPRNRITVNAAGRPVVHYTLTSPTIDGLVKGARAAARICFAAGAAAVHVPSAEPPLIERGDAARADTLIDPQHFLPGRVSVFATQLMGGCAMGQPHSAVADCWGRVHGVPWLRVADSSLFPDALEVDPGLTVMALADRVAEGIRTDAPALLGNRFTLGSNAGRAAIAVTRH